jgi:hypothetical protein
MIITPVLVFVSKVLFIRILEYVEKRVDNQ